MFSIVIPIYKGMPVAKRAIVSALAQVDVQFNVVIIDNGGCKDLAAFVGSLNDHRLIIHTYIDPVKIEDNWARILDIELNKYVTLIGHDDFLYQRLRASGPPDAQPWRDETHPGLAGALAGFVGGIAVRRLGLGPERRHGAGPEPGFQRHHVFPHAKIAVGDAHHGKARVEAELSF